MFLSYVVLLLLNYICFGINVTATADRDGDANSRDGDIWITYTLWFGTEVREGYSLKLKIAPNTNFYRVMEVAAQINPIFNFKADDTAGIGHFITEIAGVANNRTNSTYWMIYILPRKPRKDSPPTDKDLSPVGVDSIKVQENKYYLFWYKYVKF